MMSELADRLDKELVEFEKVVDRLLFSSRIAKTQEYEELASLLIECRSEVIKALRFAADMERLKIREIRGPRYSRDAWTIFHLRGGRHLMTEGPDIYTAARNAVEALEKGESDGK